MILGRETAFWAFIAILVLAHLVLHAALGYGALAPDLIAVAVLLAARWTAPPVAALLGFGLGLVADALSLTGFGASSVALVVAGWLGSRTRDLVEGSSYGFTALYLFAGKWLVDGLYLLVSPAARSGMALADLWTTLPLHALTTAAAGVLALMAHRWTVGERLGR